MERSKVMGVIAGGICLLSLVVVGTTLAQAPEPERRGTEGVPDPLIFAGSEDYPPFQWLDSDGEAQGFLIDLQNDIANQGDREAVHHLMKWEDALSAVASGEADVVALFASEERRERFGFTPPLYYVAHGAFSSAKEPVEVSPRDLAGLNIAVVDGSYAQKQLLQRSDIGELVVRSDILGALQAASRQEADIAVVAAHTARHLIDREQLNIHQVSPPFWPRPYVLAVQRGRSELLAWLEEQVALIQVSGHYYRAYNAWRPELEWQPRNLKDNLLSLAWLFVPLLMLAGVGYGWSWSLRRQVAHKTSKLSDELERRRALQSILQYRLEHDMLTDLYTREAFVKALQRLIKGDPDWQPSVIVIQLTNLEQLITTFSYRVAQELQQAFASDLNRQNFRLVSHFGSGLYAILPEATIRGEELVSRLTEPLELGEIDLDPQFVVGIVEATSTHGNPDMAEELVRRAVTAVSVAGERNRRWQTYSVSLEPNPNDMMLLQDFHRHGTRDMYLLYQPKLDLKTGKIDGAEALIRWQHPSLGLVPPDHFIPLLEQSGLIHQITRWVIAETIAMIGHHRLDESSFSISVNLSAQCLLEPDLLPFIEGLLLPHLQKSCLRLELTETGFIEEPSQARDVLTTLRAAGIGCSVDDFGSGYSSLFYLSEFPVDEVKLDRSFVSDMLENEQHYIIVRSSIALANELGLRVTAEGVEDELTIRTLADMGCDAIQGFVISRPVEKDRLISMIGEDITKYTSEP